MRGFLFEEAEVACKSSEMSLYEWDWAEQSNFQRRHSEQLYRSESLYLFFDLSFRSEAEESASFLSSFRAESAHARM